MEEKDENVVEEITQEATEQVDESKFESAGDDNVMKVDLSKPPIPKEENEIKEDNADNSGVVASTEDADAPQEQEEVQPEVQAQETPVLEEITEEENSFSEIENQYNLLRLQIKNMKENDFNLVGCDKKKKTKKRNSPHIVMKN